MLDGKAADSLFLVFTDVLKCKHGFYVLCCLSSNMPVNLICMDTGKREKGRPEPDSLPVHLSG